MNFHGGITTMNFQRSNIFLSYVFFAKFQEVQFCAGTGRHEATGNLENRLRYVRRKDQNKTKKSVCDPHKPSKLVDTTDLELTSGKLNLFIYLFIHLSIQPSINTSIHPFIHSCSFCIQLLLLLKTISMIVLHR